MTQHKNTANGRNRPAVFSTLLSVAILATIVAVAPVAQGQTFTVLHDFTNGADGGEPWAGLSMDRAGNFYGTASTGGYTGGNCSNLNPHGCGTVFKLSHKNSGWVFTPIYTFTGPDGANPQARVIIGPDGTLYGTTTNGGDYNEGVVFNLKPPATICKSALCPWIETVLYSFQGSTDGKWPAYADLVFDTAGNIYGTTPYGGQDNRGTVYKLTRTSGGWTATSIYLFQGYYDGASPFGGVVFDQAGNMWGTASEGGPYRNGTIYELVPSGGGWTENTVYAFRGPSDGANPEAGLIVDQLGNFYGGTFGINYAGAKIFELSPSSGGWTFNVLYSLAGDTGIMGSLAMDAGGNLYGTSFYNSPEVFELSPSNGAWNLTGSWAGMGDNPAGNVIVDSSGNLYTTAGNGGSNQVGMVFEITP